MKLERPNDFESYSAIATDPRGIVQSDHISKDEALKLVAQGYMMSPDLKHNWNGRYNKLARVVTMPWDQFVKFCDERKPEFKGIWNYHKGEWAQS